MEEDNVKQTSTIPAVLGVQDIRKIMTEAGIGKFAVEFADGIKNGSAVVFARENKQGKRKIIAGASLLILESLVINKETSMLSLPILFTSFYFCKDDRICRSVVIE